MFWSDGWMEQWRKCIMLAVDHYITYIPYLTVPSLRYSRRVCVWLLESCLKRGHLISSGRRGWAYWVLVWSWYGSQSDREEGCVWGCK